MQNAIGSLKSIGNFSPFNSINGDFQIGGDLIANGQSILFPPDMGTANAYLRTDGFGITTWVIPTVALLGDVSFAGLAAGQFFKFNGAAWTNQTLVPSDVGLNTLSSAGGTSTTISGTSLNIVPQVPLINSAEAGAGITGGTAGLRIKRGSATDAYFEYNEAAATFKGGLFGTTQPFEFREDTPATNGILGWDNTLKIASTALASLTTGASLTTTQGSFSFGAASGANLINLGTNLVDALTIRNPTLAVEYMKFTTTNGAPQITFPSGTLAMSSVSGASRLFLSDNLADAFTISDPTVATDLMRFQTTTGNMQLQLPIGYLAFTSGGSNYIEMPDNRTVALNIGTNGSVLTQYKTTTGAQSLTHALPVYHFQSVYYQVRSIASTTQTLDSSGNIWEFTSTSATTVTLPNGVGGHYIIIKAGTGSPVTVQTTGLETIDGTLTSVVLNNQYDRVEVVFSAFTNIWYTL